MKKKLGKILNYVVIFGTLLVVLIVGLTSNELDGGVKALLSLSFGSLLLCFVGYMGNMASDAFATWYFLRRQGCKVSFWYMLFVTIAGLYYSNITPGASGGQPMQVYYMHKKGVPMGLSVSSLVVKFFSFQFMLSFMATIFWIIYPGFIANAVREYMWFMIIGYVYNALMVSLLVLVVLKRGIVLKLCNLVLALGIRLHLVKDPENSRRRTEKAVDTFHESIALLTQHPLDLVVQMLIGAVQLMCQMSILYFIYMGLGQHGVSYGELVSVDLMEYLSAAYMPIPGAAGAQEVTFSLYFGEIFPEGVRFAALLLWRFFTYYLQLLVGAVVTFAYGWRVGEDRKAVLEDAKRYEYENTTNE